MMGTKVPVLVVGVEMFPIIAEWGLITKAVIYPKDVAGLMQIENT